MNEWRANSRKFYALLTPPPLAAIRVDGRYCAFRGMSPFRRLRTGGVTSVHVNESGCRPFATTAARTGAGVRNPSREEPAGRWAPNSAAGAMGIMGVGSRAKRMGHVIARAGAARSLAIIDCRDADLGPACEISRSQSCAKPRLTQLLSETERLVSASWHCGAPDQQPCSQLPSAAPAPF